MDPGDLLRAVRRARRLSQRELAQVCGVHPSTISRIEAEERSKQPGILLVEKILNATGYLLVVVDQQGNLLPLRDNRAQPTDRAGRLYPEHLELRRVRDMRDHWWGWHRVGFWDDDPNKPDWTFDRRPTRVRPVELDRRWNEAT